jgi:hypothetical protein
VVVLYYSPQQSNGREMNFFYSQKMRPLSNNDRSLLLKAIEKFIDSIQHVVSFLSCRLKNQENGKLWMMVSHILSYIFVGNLRHFIFLYCNATDAWFAEKGIQSISWNGTCFEFGLEEFTKPQIPSLDIFPRFLLKTGSEANYLVASSVDGIPALLDSS